MGKVTHFEVPVDDFDRAKKFYADAFDWKFMEIPMGEQGTYIMAHTTETDEKGMTNQPNVINGALISRQTQPQTNITLTVDDINAGLEAVLAAGGEKLMDPVQVGNFGMHFYAKDSEGNVIGVWQDLKKE